MTYAIGHYRNSYKALIGIEGNPLGVRVADGQIDDTCFEDGNVFYDEESALKALSDCLSYIKANPTATDAAEALEFAEAINRALLIPYETQAESEEQEIVDFGTETDADGLPY